MTSPAEVDATPTAWAVLILCSFLLIVEIVTGIFGNVLICVLVHKNKFLRTPVNALLVNLAVADLITSVTCSPVLLATLYVQPQRNGTEEVYEASSYLLASALHVTYTLCASVQLVTLTCISYERYQAIARPFDKVQRVRRVKMNIALSWLTGFVNCFIAVGAFQSDLEIQLLNQPPLTMTLKSGFMLYVFVPFSFLCVALILIIYFLILYMVQKHVKQSSYLLKRKAKVAPAKGVEATEEGDKHSTVINCTDIVKPAASAVSSSVMFREESVHACASERRDSANTVDTIETAGHPPPLNQDLVKYMRKLNLVPVNLKKDSESLTMKRNMLDRRSTGFIKSHFRSVEEVLGESAGCDHKPQSGLRRVSYHDGVDRCEYYQNNDVSGNDKQVPRECIKDRNYIYRNGKLLEKSIDSKQNSKEEVDVKEESDRERDFANSVPACQKTASGMADVAGKQAISSRAQTRRKITKGALTVTHNVPGLDESFMSLQTFATTSTSLSNLSDTGQTLLSQHVPASKEIQLCEVKSNFEGSRCHSESPVHLSPTRVPITEELEKVKTNTSERKTRTELNNGADSDITNKISPPIIEVCDMDGGKIHVVATKSDVVGSICMMNTANKERGKRRVEAKTAKIAAIVISAFLVCWLPFPIVVVVGRIQNQSVYDHIELSSLDEWFVVALSLAILGAAINPIAYGIVNKQIRNEIRKLFQSWRKGIRK